ncbi:hypothetical protein L4D76_01610 [Photobacterium sagamiensis]|uniref:hypothetical protein n=1 Tax=Photobacterium sagamiensis TaxID=2910241 RepID=UPI003D0D24FB
MSNRDIQPFQFACPSCEETIKFTFGVPDGALSGATEVKAINGIFDGSNPFVDLHLDFPVFFGEYEKGNTTFFNVIDAIGREALAHLNNRLNTLNNLYPKCRDLKRVITQKGRCISRSLYSDIDNVFTLYNS